MQPNSDWTDATLKRSMGGLSKDLAFTQRVRAYVFGESQSSGIPTSITEDSLKLVTQANCTFTLRGIIAPSPNTAAASASNNNSTNDASAVAASAATAPGTRGAQQQAPLDPAAAAASALAITAALEDVPRTPSCALVTEGTLQYITVAAPDAGGKGYSSGSGSGTGGGAGAGGGLDEAGWAALRQGCVFRVRVVSARLPQRGNLRAGNAAVLSGRSGAGSGTATTGVAAGGKPGKAAGGDDEEEGGDDAVAAGANAGANEDEYEGEADPRDEPAAVDAEHEREVERMNRARAGLSA